MRNRLSALAPAAAMVGGLLWIVYAILLLVRRDAPLSSAALTGAVALAVLAVALLAAVRLLGLPAEKAGRFGVAMGWVTLLAAGAALAGGLLRLEPLAANALTAGEVLLACGVMLVAIEAAGAPSSNSVGSTLFVIGAVGMLGLLAQALAALAAWMLPIYAALVMAIYGLAWVRFGGWLARQE